MALMQYLRPIIFGAMKPKPLRGFPQGKATITALPDQFAQVSVKRQRCTRRFYVKEVNGFWEPSLEQRRKTP